VVSIHDKGNVSLLLSGLHKLLSLRTVYHQVKVYRHSHLGRILVLDGEIQHVEVWAPLYHEPLIHLPAAFIRKPRTALVLGGGSLFAARELLKYRSIERLLVLDHDAQLLEAICEIYEHAARVRSDPRVEIWTKDAFSTLPRMTERFDLVINDSIDLLSIRPRSAFISMANLLRPKGVCSDVVYRHVFESSGLRRTLRLLGSTYRTVASLIVAPEYPGVLHLLTLWGKNRFLSQNLKKTLNLEQRAWAATNSSICSYFDARFLHYYLHLPQYVRNQLQRQIST
jgi:spermidine synthase